MYKDKNRFEGLFINMALNLGFHFGMGIALTSVIYGAIYLFTPKKQNYQPPESTSKQLSKIDFTR